MHAVFAYEWLSANHIRGEVHSADEDLAVVDVEAAADADNTKEENVYKSEFDRLKYTIESVIRNREKVTETILFFGGCKHCARRSTWKGNSRWRIWNALYRFQSGCLWS